MSVWYFLEEYLYVTEAPGQQMTEAQTRTPLLGPSGPVCTLSFDFALTGSPDHIGNWMNLYFDVASFYSTFFFLPTFNYDVTPLQASCPSEWLTAYWECGLNSGSSAGRQEQRRMHGNTWMYLLDSGNIASRSTLFVFWLFFFTRGGLVNPYLHVKKTFLLSAKQRCQQVTSVTCMLEIFALIVRFDSQIKVRNFWWLDY